MTDMKMDMCMDIDMCMPMDMGCCSMVNLGDMNMISNMENGKAFLKDMLNLTSCEISMNCLPAHCKIPFSHKHKQNEEIYIFLKGEGRMYVDDKCMMVKEGTCMKIMPEASRMLENTCDMDMQYICMQAKMNSLEQCGMDDAIMC